MIDLSQLLPAPVTVQLGRGEAPVYGLNLAQLSTLLNENSEHLQRFLANEKPDMEALLIQLPDLAVKLIAIGLRCEGQEAAVRNMSLATQIEVLLTVWELSVPDVKKLAARVSQFMDGAKNLAAKVQQPSPNPSATPLPTQSNT